MMANFVADGFGHSSSSNFHTYLDIYCQNIRGLRTKASELLTNVHSSHFPVICLTETWLNDFCFNQNLFPETYLVYRADRVSAAKSRGRGSLIAISNSVSGVVRRADLELVEECVWVEIPTTDGYNLLIGNHYFAPHTSVDTIKQYFCSLENVLNTYNFRVLVVGDFNVPGFDWKLGLSSSSSYSYIKLKGEAIYTSTYLLGLSQHNYSRNNGNLLDLIFSNITDFSINFDVQSLVHPDVYHPPFVTELQLPTRRSNMFSSISPGDYLMLHNTLSTYDWSPFYNETSVDAAVDGLTVAVTHAIAKSVPTGRTNRCKFPVWFSIELKSYIREKNYF
jgi:hypothetical protein